MTDEFVLIRRAVLLDALGRLSAIAYKSNDRELDELNNQLRDAATPAPIDGKAAELADAAKRLAAGLTTMNRTSVEEGQ